MLFHWCRGAAWDCKPLANTRASTCIEPKMGHAPQGRGHFGCSGYLVDAGNTERPAKTEPARDQPKLRASLAHEINNPLQSLVSLLHLLEADPSLSEESRRHLILAREEAHRVSRIARAAMNDLQDTVEPEKISVADLVSSVLAFYASRFTARGISIDARYRPVKDLVVRADPLRQAFSSLLLNATDALPSGGIVYVRVTPSNEWSGQRRRGLRVTFADNGSGISVENLSKIAERFFTTKGSTGTGIGLSLVQDVVRSHDGTLRVRSSTKPGRSGSIFQMFLPAT
jgi:signal transduction histidine kinase